MVSDLGSRINADQASFWRKYRQIIKDGITDYLSHEGYTITDDQRGVTISVPRIDIPQFRFKLPKGDRPSWIPYARRKKHPTIKVDFPLDMIVDILIEKMELPRLNPSTNQDLLGLKQVYTSLRRTGPR